MARPGPWALGAWAPADAAALLGELQRGDGRLAGLLVDDRELTALLPEERLPGLPAPRALERGFAALTLDTVMAWDVVGVLAHVTARLAAASIPLGAVTAFSRDHLLVPAARLDAALEVLAPHFAAVRRPG